MSVFLRFENKKTNHNKRTIISQEAFFDQFSFKEFKNFVRKINLGIHDGSCEVPKLSLEYTTVYISHWDLLKY